MKLSNSNTLDSITPTQQLMIRACLATSKEDREQAVKGWEEQVVIDDLEYSSSRLVPYFLDGNQKCGIVTKHDKRLKIIYKHWWLRMQHINHQLKIVYAALYSEGINAVIIKGASIKEHYEHDELRPMADFDLLVHRKDIFRAIDVTKRLDYLPHQSSEVFLRKTTDLNMDFSHGFYHQHQKSDAQVDLHWRIGSYCSLDFTNSLWLHLTNYESFANAKKPQLPYEVFMIVIHAAAANSKDNLNWIIDIDLINKKYDLSFWEAARRLAVIEKKEDLFDYGCSILIGLGVYAPNPGSVKKPSEIVISIIPELKQNVSFIKLLRIRIGNSVNLVNRLYPYSNVVVKIYQFTRHIYLLALSRKFAKETIPGDGSFT